MAKASAAPAASCRFSIEIPSEAVGRIIGQGGCFIKYLRSTDGMRRCLLRDGESLNTRLLVMEGTQAAVASIHGEVKRRINVGRTQLENQSRADHSWTLTSNEQLLTPRMVHRTGKKTPKLVHGRGKNRYAAKQQCKRVEKEKQVAASLREQLRREENM